MHLNDVGNWTVLWLNKNGLKHGQASAFAFFTTRDQAQAFVSEVGGVLYLRSGDGKLVQQ